MTLLEQLQKHTQGIEAEWTPDLSIAAGPETRTRQDQYF